MASSVGHQQDHKHSYLSKRVGVAAAPIAVVVVAVAVVAVVVDVVVVEHSHAEIRHSVAPLCSSQRQGQVHTSAAMALLAVDVFVEVVVPDIAVVHAEVRCAV